MVSYSGIYGMCGSFRPGLLSNPCGLSPLGTNLEEIIFLRAALRGVLMKRALKKLFGTPFTGVWGGMFFIYICMRAACTCGNFNFWVLAKFQIP